MRDVYNDVIKHKGAGELAKNCSDYINVNIPDASAVQTAFTFDPDATDPKTQAIEYANRGLDAMTDTEKEAYAAKAVTEDDSLKQFPTNLEKLEDMCSDVVNGESDEERTKRRNANLIAGAVTSAVGSALAVGIAKTVIDLKYENIQDEAVKQWMEEIGSHIQCMIGTEEAGSYGDTVAIDYD